MFLFSRWLLKVYNTFIFTQFRIFKFRIFSIVQQFFYVAIPMGWILSFFALSHRYVLALNKQPCHQFLIFKSSSSVLNPDQVSDVIRLEEHKHRATQRQFRLTIQASFHFFPIETLVTTLYLNDKEVTATFLSCASSLELT